MGFMTVGSSPKGDLQGGGCRCSSWVSRSAADSRPSTTARSHWYKKLVIKFKRSVNTSRPIFTRPSNDPQISIKCRSSGGGCLGGGIIE